MIYRLRPRYWLLRIAGYTPQDARVHIYWNEKILKVSEDIFTEWKKNGSNPWLKDQTTESKIVL